MMMTLFRHGMTEETQFPGSCFPRWCREIS